MFHDVTNNFNVMGRITREVEIKSFANGGKLGTFSICHNGGYKGKDGKWVEKPTFVEVKVQGDRADYIAEKFQKGHKVFATGKLEQENWDTPDGQKRSKLVLNLVEIRSLEFKATNAGSNTDEVQESKPAAAPAGKKAAATRKPANTVPVPEEAPPEGNPDEDIPF